MKALDNLKTKEELEIMERNVIKKIQAKLMRIYEDVAEATLFNKYNVNLT